MRKRCESCGRVPKLKNNNPFRFRVFYTIFRSSESPPKPLRICRSCFRFGKIANMY